MTVRRLTPPVLLAGTFTGLLHVSLMIVRVLWIVR